MSPQEAAMSLGAILSAGLDPSDVSVTLSVKETQALRLAISALEREAKAEPVAWLLRFGENGQYRSVRIVHPGATYADQELTPLYASPPKEALTAGVVSGCKHPPRQDGSGSSRDIPEEWQPIETAPRDGTPILLYFPHRDLVIRGSYEWQGEGDWEMDIPDWMDWTTDDDVVIQEDPSYAPTQWMPLPAPPAPETKGDRV